MMPDRSASLRQFETKVTHGQHKQTFAPIVMARSSDEAINQAIELAFEVGIPYTAITFIFVRPVHES